MLLVWSKKYPVKGYQYELQVSDNLSDNFHFLRLSLKGDSYSTWIFCIDEQHNPNKAFFSSIQKYIGLIKLDSLEVSIEYAEKCFTSNDFREFIEKVINVNK